MHSPVSYSRYCTTKGLTDHTRRWNLAVYGSNKEMWQINMLSLESACPGFHSMFIWLDVLHACSAFCFSFLRLSGNHRICGSSHTVMAIGSVKWVLQWCCFLLRSPRENIPCLSLTCGDLLVSLDILHFQLFIPFLSILTCLSPSVPVCPKPLPP